MGYAPPHHMAHIQRPDPPHVNPHVSRDGRPHAPRYLTVPSPYRPTPSRSETRSPSSVTDARGAPGVLCHFFAQFFPSPPFSPFPFPSSSFVGRTEREGSWELQVSRSFSLIDPLPVNYSRWGWGVKRLHCFWVLIRELASAPALFLCLSWFRRISIPGIPSGPFLIVGRAAVSLVRRIGLDSSAIAPGRIGEKRSKISRPPRA
ncbi:hypothetical protein NL676_017063 [Syzygium grande]|nr:hypothetical protein NL676_017063 [Syzygium grande]